MKKQLFLSILILVYILFVSFSYYWGLDNGKQAFVSLLQFTKQMALLLPFAFVLIGLFEVWVKRETIERFLGLKTGFSGYVLAVLLAGTTVGGLYVAFPFAYSLYKKGAKLGVIFTYLSCAGICRIPMTVFEASFLGIKFTLIRFLISLPLVIVTSWLMERLLKNQNYALLEPSMQKGEQ